MKDLNFFEPFMQKPKEKKSPKGLLIGVALGVLALVLVAFMIFRQIKLNNMKNVVASLKATAEDAKILETVEKVKAKEAEKNAFAESVKKLRELDNTITAKDKISGKVFEQVTSSMPDSIFLSTIELNEQGYNMSGIAQDRWSVAEFAAQLEKIEGVQTVFTPNIQYKDGFFDFSMQVGFTENLPELTESGESGEKKKLEDYGDGQIVKPVDVEAMEEQINAPGD